MDSGRVRLIVLVSHLVPNILCYNYLVYSQNEMTHLKPVPRFRALRQAQGLTQLEMSQLLGVTENTYANWEKGRNSIEIIERVVKLCKLFNCTAKDLLSYEDIRL